MERKMMTVAFAVMSVLIALMLVHVAHAEEIIAEIHTQDDAVEIQEGPPINDVSIDLDEVDANGHQLKYLGKFFITYYCSCRKCNGRNAGIDGFGNPLEWGCVAVDRKVIPMHTKLVIDGYDMVFEARDTGSGITGHDIDIYVPVSHQEAVAMCKDQWLNVWEYKENKNDK